MFERFLAHAAIGLLATAISTTALAEPIDEMVGDYHMVSSNTVPDTHWGFTKGRIAIRRVDDRHMSIVLACGWKKIPKAICSERYYAQQRNGAIYLGDMHSFHFKMEFDRAAHRLTVITQGAQGSIRHDVYEATSAALTDTDLVRRMRNERRYIDNGADLKTFGPLRKWEFQKNRIVFRTGR